jgi:hypothetical protein
LDTVTLGGQPRRLFEPVAQQVDTLVAGVRAQFDPADHGHPVDPLDRTLQSRVVTVVVGDGDGLDTARLGCRRQLCECQHTVRDGRVEVEICDCHDTV